MKISDEVKQFVAESPVKMVATASKDGKPSVSAKGSLAIFDDGHLVFADIRSPGTIANLNENAKIAIMCFNPETRHGCRIWGRAEVLNSGEVFDQVAEKWTNSNRKVNHIVKVAVDEMVTF